MVMLTTLTDENFKRELEFNQKRIPLYYSNKTKKWKKIKNEEYIKHQKEEMKKNFEQLFSIARDRQDFLNEKNKLTKKNFLLSKVVEALTEYPNSEGNENIICALLDKIDEKDKIIEELNINP